jgi:general secretion pathway protein G
MSVIFVQNQFRTRGFTLVEILVVISIIAILAAFVFGRFSNARTNSKIAKAEVELESIKAALKLHKEVTGSMPPGGDSCTMCGWRSGNTETQAQWETVVVPYVSARTPARMPVRDPWGRHYAYDNNFLVMIADYPSAVCSVGPNGVLNTWVSETETAALSLSELKVAQGDDVCIFFTEPDDTEPASPGGGGGD